MTIAEFKAWLEGFSLGRDDVPNAEQWAVIKEKVEQLRETDTFYLPPDSRWRDLPVAPWTAPSKPWWEQPVTMKDEPLIARGI